MKVLMIVNSSKDLEYKLSLEIASYLKEKNICLYTDDVELVNKTTFINKYDDGTDIDFAVVLGGDGTILKYAHDYEGNLFPFLGINLGRVGALALVEKDNYKEVFDKVLSGDYFIETQNGLDVSIKYNETNEVVNLTAFNDVIIHRGLSLNLLSMFVSVNDCREDKFYADGLVVATPVGSSAYNASAGGPLLYRGSKAYVLTPICPQLKSFSSLVVDENDEIRVKLGTGKNCIKKEYIVSTDGNKKFFVSTDDEVFIKKSNTILKMIRVDKHGSIYTSVHKAVVSIRKGE